MPTPALNFNISQLFSLPVRTPVTQTTGWWRKIWRRKLGFISWREIWCLGYCGLFSFRIRLNRRGRATVNYLSSERPPYFKGNRKTKRAKKSIPLSSVLLAALHRAKEIRHFETTSSKLQARLHWTPSGAFACRCLLGPKTPYKLFRLLVSICGTTITPIIFRRLSARMR